MKQIPCIDLKEQTGQLKAQVLAAVEQVCDQAAFSGGPFVEVFEKEFAEFLNFLSVIALNFNKVMYIRSINKSVFNFL